MFFTYDNVALLSLELENMKPCVAAFRIQRNFTQWTQQSFFSVYFSLSHYPQVFKGMFWWFWSDFVARHEVNQRLTHCHQNQYGSQSHWYQFPLLSFKYRKMFSRPLWWVQSRWCRIRRAHHKRRRKKTTMRIHVILNDALWLHLWCPCDTDPVCAVWIVDTRLTCQFSQVRTSTSCLWQKVTSPSFSFLYSSNKTTIQTVPHIVTLLSMQASANCKVLVTVLVNIVTQLL